MTQGIRQFTVNTFANMLKQRQKLGDTEFRRAVMNAAIEEFDITTASAATAYNFALQKAREEMPEKVEGLGRDPDKNNGGPKPQHTVSVIKSRSREIVAEGLSRRKAQQMVDESSGQGRPKLEIYDPNEGEDGGEEEVAPRFAPAVQHNRRTTDVQPQRGRPVGSRNGQGQRRDRRTQAA
jgi:hypothetical protein